MRKRECVFSKRSLLLCGMWLFATLAAAEEGSATDRVPLRSMSQAEYELYREQLQKQVKKAAADMPDPGKAAAEDAAEKDAAEKDKSEESGYGRGYRARSERSRTGGGYRSGSMSRGGGRGR